MPDARDEPHQVLRDQRLVEPGPLAILPDHQKIRLVLQGIVGDRLRLALLTPNDVDQDAGWSVDIGSIQKEKQFAVICLDDGRRRVAVFR